MEVKEEQTIIKNACCICGNPNNINSHNILDNFIKYKDSFVPFVEVIRQTLNFEVSSNQCCDKFQGLKIFSKFRFRQKIIQWKFVDYAKTN